jgi:hypothetical protein
MITNVPANYDAVASLVTLQMQQIAVSKAILSLLVEQRVQGMSDEERKAFIEVVEQTEKDALHDAMNLLIPSKG